MGVDWKNRLWIVVLVILLISLLAGVLLHEFGVGDTAAVLGIKPKSPVSTSNPSPR
jgi:hypothetical protein